MASTPGRHRGSRPQIQNAIGELGRTTGVKPPKRVQRDSNDFENPRDYFNKAQRESEPESQDEEEDGDAGVDDGDSDELSLAGSPTKSARSSAKKVTARRAPRQDNYLVGEGRGRRTGIVREEGPRDEDGYENPGDFFNANSSPQSVATTQYSVRRTAQSSRTYERSGSYEEEDVDMSLAETSATGISPSVYQRRTQALSTSTTVTASNSAARKPSSLRQSTLPSDSATTSRRGLPNAKTPSSGSRDGEEADARNQTSAQRRRLSSLGRDGREGRGGRDDDGEDEEPFVEDLDLGSDAEHDGEANTTLGDRTIQGEVEEEDEDEEEEEEEEVRRGGSSGRKSGQSRQSRASEVSTSTRNETRASSAGLVKLDKNGKAVAFQDKKGKGKEVVRSPSPRYEQGDEDMNNNFDTGDFGGGGDSDSEAAGFTYGDDGDGSEPQAQVEPDDEDQGVASEELGVEHEDEDEPGSDAQEEEEEEQPRASKAKSKAKSQPKVKVVKGAPEKKRGKKRASDASNASGRTVVAKRARRATTVEEAVVERVPRDRDAGSVEVDGVRRSNRQRLPPLEYWRNERVIYRKRSSGVGMSAIVRIPKVEPEPLGKAGKKKRSKTSAPRSKGKSARSVKSESEDEDEEDRIDGMTDPDGLVWNWENGEETTRRIAFTENMMDPKPTFNNQYQFQKIYQELDYLAGGILDIPVGGKKDTKPAKDNSYLFFCAKGSVSVLCHRTRVAIGRGGTFFIPRGNSYSIEATSNRPVRLFFAQGRRVIELEDGTTRPDTQEASQQVRDAQEQLAREQARAQESGSEREGSASEEEQVAEEDEEEED